MSRILLSAALIVRNEERFLGQCLLSIRELVDEIVIVDTGSTDRTREIARAHGASLHDFKWIDDFSAARNHALDLARGAWILYIDADERVRSCAASQLRAQLSDPAHVASLVLLHPRPGFTPYWELRLFRNDPQIRFRGIIHETIWPGIRAYRSTHGGRVSRSTVVLEHEGYEGDQRHKHRRNLPLLRRALWDDPGRVFSWCHLASIYTDLGKLRLAKRSWKIALDAVRKKSWRQADDCLPYIGLIGFDLARGRDVEPLLTEAVERFPRNLQLHWLRGRTLMDAGRFAEAILAFEGLISRGQAGDFDYSMAYDTRLFSLFSYDALANCHFKVGNYREGGRYFELAAQVNPDSLEYRVKGALCSRLERSHSGFQGAASPRTPEGLLAASP